MLTNISHYLASKENVTNKRHTSEKIFLHLHFVCVYERFLLEAIHANIVTP